MEDDQGVFQGKLLVAQPALTDPNFARTVIFVLAHGDQGALGLVLDRPTLTSLSGPLPEWEDLASGPAVVFVGGPVSEGTICLARVRPRVSVPGRGYLPLQGSIGTVDLDADPLMVGPWIKDLRIFAGYAGWAPGQLEGEVSMGSWWVFDAVEEDIFAAGPSDLWKQVLRRQGDHFALMAAFPADPSLN